MYCYFNEIIKGPGTNFRSPTLSQKHVKISVIQRTSALVFGQMLFC